MTNLDIIKYLALNNPARLAVLLDDIYCIAWNNGAFTQYLEDELREKSKVYYFNEWLQEDADRGGFYRSNELEEWNEVINGNTIEVTYPNGHIVTFPYKDLTYAWNTNNDFTIKISKKGE